VIMSNYMQVLQEMLRQLSKYNNNAVVSPSVSVNSPVANVVALSPSTPGVINSVSVSKTSASTSIPQGIAQSAPRQSEIRNHWGADHLR